MNPYSSGLPLYLLPAVIATAAVLALFLDAASDGVRRRLREPPAMLTFFGMLSMLLCVALSLAISSSLPVFVVGSVALAVANGVSYSLAIHRSSLPSRRYWAATTSVVFLGSCGLLMLSTDTLSMDPPPWGCPGTTNSNIAAGPPWGCIDTAAGGSLFSALVPPLVGLICLFLVLLAVLAGGRNDGGRTVLPPGAKVYKPHVLTVYGQPLFWAILGKVMFFCFGANVGGELLNLKDCDEVALWEWTKCGPPHDIVLDILGTCFGVGLFVTMFNFPEICHKGVLRGRVAPVDEAILDRWFLRPWPTGRRIKLLRQFVILRAVMMGLACTIIIGVPTVCVLILIGPADQPIFGQAGIGWLGITPTVHGFGWWDGNFDRWTFVWVKSSFACALGVISVVVGYAAGTSRELVSDITEKEARFARTPMADLLPNPFALVLAILFVTGLVLGSVGAACLDNTLVGTTCSYDVSVVLLSVGWPLAGVTGAALAGFPQLKQAAERVLQEIDAAPATPPVRDVGLRGQLLSRAYSGPAAGSIPGDGGGGTMAGLPAPGAEAGVDAVCVWVGALGLPVGVVDQFRRNEIDGEALVELSMDSELAEHALEQLGIEAYGHRAKIRKALRGVGGIGAVGSSGQGQQPWQLDNALSGRLSM